MKRIFLKYFKGYSTCYFQISTLFILKLLQNMAILNEMDPDCKISRVHAHSLCYALHIMQYMYFISD